MNRPPHHRLRSNAAALVLLTLTAALWAQPAAAQPVEPKPVVVAPSFPIFLPRPADQSTDALAEAFRYGAARYAANHPETFELISQSELVDQIASQSNFEIKLELADLRAQTGIDRYRNLQIAEAIQNIEQGLEHYRKLGYQLIAPQRLAEIVMFLTLSYVEQGEEMLKPVELMQQMVLLDPDRTIREGFYPDRLVRSYWQARDSIVDELRSEGPDSAQIDALVARSGARFAAFGYVFPNPDGTYVAGLWLWDELDRELLDPEFIVLETLSPETLEAAGNRLMSRFQSCTIDPPAPQPGTMVSSQGDGPFRLGVHLAYASFLRTPRLVERPFGNMGLAVGAHLLLTRDFGLSGGVHILNSFRDYSGLILNDFTTLRGFLGGEFGFAVGDWLMGTQIAVEATRIGDFYACGEDAPLNCPVTEEGKVLVDDFDLLMGINLRPQVAWNFYRSFHAAVGGSVSYFFYPLSGSEMNFPLTGEAGIMYRF